MLNKRWVDITNFFNSDSGSSSESKTVFRKLKHEKSDNLWYPPRFSHLVRWTNKVGIFTKTRFNCGNENQLWRSVFSRIRNMRHVACPYQKDFGLVIQGLSKRDLLVFSFKLKLHRTLQRHYSYSVIGNIKIIWVEKLKFLLRHFARVENSFHLFLFLREYFCFYTNLKASIWTIQKRNKFHR